MRRPRTSPALGVLGALPLIASLSGCGFVLSFADDDTPERRPPDGGPPVGGQDVVEWDGDAALAPDAADVEDSGPDDERDAGVDGGERDAGRDGGDLDGGDGGASDGGTGDDGGSTTPDAGVDGGPTPTSPPCGTLSSLRDDFSQYPSDWLLEESGDVSVSHEPGGVRFDIPTGSTRPTGYGRLVARHLTALRGDDLHLQLSTPGSSVTTLLSLVGPGGSDDLLRIRRDGTSYRVVVVSGGVEEPVLVHTSETPYAHWRIRALADGRVRFQLSADGSSWVTLLTQDALPWIGHVRAVLRVEGRGAQSDETVVVDAVRGRYSSPTWCPLGALEESFEQPLSPAFSTPVLQSCEVSVEAGALVLAQSSDGPLHCAVHATTPRALEGQTLVVRLSEWPAADLEDTFAGLRVVLGGTHELYFGMRAGALRATVQAFDAVDSHSGPSQPVSAGPLDLKLDVSAGGVATFSYGDGVDFTQLWQHTLPTLDDAIVTLVLVTFGDEVTSASSGVRLRVEGLNAE